MSTIMDFMSTSGTISGSPNVVYAAASVVVAAVGAAGYYMYLNSRRLPNFAKITGVPNPKPLRDFDISTAKPRPYRPFRWSYHQTMSLKNMEPDFWIELESTYVERIEQRKALYAEHSVKVIDAQPGPNPSDPLTTERACTELMHMCISFLTHRYPSCFSYTLPLFPGSKPQLRNHILNRSFDVPFVGDEWNKGGITALKVILENVPEDFLITLLDEKTGIYHLRAGVSCSAVGWNMQEKIGKRLNEIHEPVPDYKEKMEFSMDRYFSKMPLDKPIQRGSWGLEIDQPLFCAADSPHFALRNTQPPTLTPSRIHLRVDWQTLRRLPTSRAIVFNFKALFTPMEEFRDEPYIPALLVKILKEGKENIMEYKGTWHVNHVALPCLEEWAREQVEKGLVEKGWKERTLDEDPYFPGWERKWRKSTKT